MHVGEKLVHCLATLYSLGCLLLVTLVFLPLFPLHHAWCRMARRMSRRAAARHLIWLYGRSCVLCIRPLTGEKIRMPGADDFPSPCIVVSNHLSMLDVFFMSALPTSDIMVVVRSWPFRLFWYAPFMRMAGYLDIESTPPERVHVEIWESLEKGGVVIFFPEGHRSRNGRLQRFRSGAFKYAVEFGVPVLPVCLSGTDRLLPRGACLMRPAMIRVTALRPVDPKEFEGELGHVALRKHVKAMMAEELEEYQESMPNNV